MSDTLQGLLMGPATTYFPSWKNILSQGKLSDEKKYQSDCGFAFHIYALIFMQNAYLLSLRNQSVLDICFLKFLSTAASPSLQDFFEYGSDFMGFFLFFF